MANTSATGGYLVPGLTPTPLQGQSFEDFIQEVFVGISGIDPTLVRPRFQTEGINLPPAGTTWASFGASEYNPDTFAVTDWDGEHIGELQRNEEVIFLCSFYGPNNADKMSQLRDGLQVEQNRAVLLANKMTVVETGKGLRAPSLVKEKWLDRVDMEVKIRRLIQRSYPILSLLSANLEINNEIEIISINITEE
jgi:hypothetical protein